MNIKQTSRSFLTCNTVKQHTNKLNQRSSVNDYAYKYANNDMTSWSNDDKQAAEIDNIKSTLRISTMTL